MDGSTNEHDPPLDCPLHVDHGRKTAPEYLAGPWTRVKEARDENAAIVEALLLRENGIWAELGTRDGIPIESDRELPGLWVWVPANDLENARWILWQWEVRRNTPPRRFRCPKCGSSEIYRYRRPSFPQWIFGFICWPTLIALIGNLITPKHECYRCHHRWPRYKPGHGFPVLPPRGDDEAKKPD